MITKKKLLELIKDAPDDAYVMWDDGENVVPIESAEYKEVIFSDGEVSAPDNVIVLADHEQ